MTERAKKLLLKMANSLDNGCKNDFDSMFYISFHHTVIDELESLGCINVENDIIGSIKLTEYGYKLSKE